MGDRTNAQAPTSTQAGVLRPDEFARHVRLERTGCAPAVAGWVENHWSITWQLPPGVRTATSVLPHPAATLSVERGSPRPEAGGEPVVVTGVVTRRFDVTISGSGWVHGVKFRPGGLTGLTGTAARDLRDRTVAARAVFPSAVVAVLDGLQQTDPIAARAAAIDSALATLPGSPDPDYRALLDVIGLMLGDRCLVRVAQVEQASGIATRTLQRMFEHYVGVSPKWVLSRYRMHDVVAALDAGYDGTLAALAVEYGWFDQAHFTREFSDLVGVPPGSYRSGQPA